MLRRRPSVYGARSADRDERTRNSLRNGPSGEPAMPLRHEQVHIRRGPRSGLPVIVAVHSTALGQAIGGCRITSYPHWRDALDDALRLSAAMTDKCAVAG